VVPVTQSAVVVGPGAYQAHGWGGFPFNFGMRSGNVVPAATRPERSPHLGRLCRGALRGWAACKAYYDLVAVAERTDANEGIRLD